MVACTSSGYHSHSRIGSLLARRLSSGPAHRKTSTKAPLRGSVTRWGTRHAALSRRRDSSRCCSSAIRSVVRHPPTRPRRSMAPRRIRAFWVSTPIRLPSFFTHGTGLHGLPRASSAPSAPSNDGSPVGFGSRTVSLRELPRPKKPRCVPKRPFAGTDPILRCSASSISAAADNSTPPCRSSPSRTVRTIWTSSGSEGTRCREWFESSTTGAPHERRDHPVVLSRRSVRARCKAGGEHPVGDRPRARAVRGVPVGRHQETVQQRSPDEQISTCRNEGERHRGG